MIKINDVEILTVGDNMTWSGEKDIVARTLDFEILYVPEDKNFPRYQVKVGDKVEWIENNKTFFIGYVQNLSYSTDGESISISCIDLMVRLLKSKCIGRFNGTLNDLCNNICGLFGLKNGINIDNTLVHNIVSDGDKSYFDILNIALSTIYSRFCLYLDGITLKLVDDEPVGLFETRKNIYNSSYSQNMDDIVTKVLIIDNNGKLMNSVQDDAALQQFGLFQEVYNYNKDCKNNFAEAKKLLKTVENEATITTKDDILCISGKLIFIEEEFSNLSGVFEIISDTHIIGSQDIMTLKAKYLYGMKNKQIIENKNIIENKIDTPYNNKQLTTEDLNIISQCMIQARKEAKEEIEFHIDFFNTKQDAELAYWEEYTKRLNDLLKQKGYKKENGKWVKI